MQASCRSGPTMSPTMSWDAGRHERFEHGHRADIGGAPPSDARVASTASCRPFHRRPAASALIRKGAVGQVASAATSWCRVLASPGQGGTPAAPRSPGPGFAGSWHTAPTGRIAGSAGSPNLLTPSQHPGVSRPAVSDCTMPLSCTFADPNCRPVSLQTAWCCGVREHFGSSRGRVSSQEAARLHRR